MPACGAVFVIFVGNFGKIPVDKHSAINCLDTLVVRASLFIVTEDQYVAWANVSMKNANAMSGFVSYNVSQLR
jgi:hypothetical protein